MLTFTAGAMAMRYFNLYTPCFDFGIFTQMFENMKDGVGPVTTVERNYELSHFAVHFSPAYYLMLPFYLIYPHPVTLQILQGLFVTSGIIPVFLIARKYGFSKIHSALISAIYALYPAFTGGCTYDMHENCMLPALILWLIWAIEREKTIPIFVFALLTLTVKEDAAVYVAVIALYLLLSDRSKKIRKLSVFILAGAIVYFLCACLYLNSNGLGIMDWRYKELYRSDARRTRIYSACKQEIRTLHITDTVCACQSDADVHISALNILPICIRFLFTSDMALYNESVGAFIQQGKMLYCILSYRLCGNVCVNYVGAGKQLLYFR